MAHKLCRFCTEQDIGALAQTYAGVVVGDVETKVKRCEQEFAACCTTWCTSCSKVTIVCVQSFDGDSSQSGILSQVVLWQQLCDLQAD
jgi:hypothetical protein